MKNNKFLILMRGIPGSGKSTVAKKLASEIKAVLVEYDDIKSELIDLLKNDNLATISYKIARSIIKSNLNVGNNVIFDSLGYFEENYKKCKKLLPKGYEMIILECRCDNSVLCKRLTNRRNIKKAQGNDYNSAIYSFKNIEKIKHPNFLILDTTKSIDNTINLILNYLHNI